MTEPQPRQEEEEESAAVADSAVVHELKNPRDAFGSNANANASLAPPTKKFKTDDATAASATDVTATAALCNSKICQGCRASKRVISNSAMSHLIKGLW